MESKGHKVQTVLIYAGHYPSSLISQHTRPRYHLKLMCFIMIIGLMFFLFLVYAYCAAFWSNKRNNNHTEMKPHSQCMQNFSTLKLTFIIIDQNRTGLHISVPPKLCIQILNKMDYQYCYLIQ